MSSSQSIARELLDAYDHGRLIPAIAERDPGFDWAAAYDVAAEIVKLRRARGERCVGRKVGFTNRNIWAEYGATSPIWAHVYDSTLIYAKNNKASVSLRGSVAPRIEPELAFRLRAPVPAGCEDPAAVLQSIEWLAPSFEIVDCHFTNWKFTPADSAALFRRHAAWLEGSLAKVHAGPTVVITHHAPSQMSIHPRFAGSLLNACFVSAAERLIDGGRARLWIHGHTHDSFDYFLNGTRVVCNPRGYAKNGMNENPLFDANFSVEIN